jgi:hypothetical protein
MPPIIVGTQYHDSVRKPLRSNPLTVPPVTEAIRHEKVAGLEIRKRRTSPGASKRAVRDTLL